MTYIGSFDPTSLKKQFEIKEKIPESGVYLHKVLFVLQEYKRTHDNKSMANVASKILGELMQAEVDKFKTLESAEKAEKKEESLAQRNLCRARLLLYQRAVVHVNDPGR